MTQVLLEMTTEQEIAIGHLLVEALAGEISPKTRTKIGEIEHPSDLPQPFQHLVSYAQGYALDNKSMALDLTEEIRGVCAELLDPNAPK